MSKLDVVAVVAVLVLLGIGIGLARAHTTASGWEYDQWCCNHLDCRQLADNDVDEVNGGWYVKSIDVLVPYKHPEIRVSGDAHFHVCELPKGTVRCFYVPPGGV